MKEKNQNFFYEVDVEVDHSIKNTFWTDARSRMIHESFLERRRMIRVSNVRDMKSSSIVPYVYRTQCISYLDWGYVDLPKARLQESFIEIEEMCQFPQEVVWDI
ncbi:hypothetical protein Ahy_B01g055695 [Arachis hypogaea]|uniref:Protein FAR1-RELATED SEQUENCE n=1 Tax=Arachis hypogaea TaxID=3818 RepID=A0A445AWT7_ARAHY|nr:hypothetical protein Ahy_B01g055695 [Arachis hypogaea]